MEFLNFRVEVPLTMPLGHEDTGDYLVFYNTRAEVQTPLRHLNPFTEMEDLSVEVTMVRAMGSVVERDYVENLISKSSFDHPHGLLWERIHSIEDRLGEANTS
ncbi:unnamed protein product [Owenia fusiformis]|uniref:Uncharacterized protein n=1 Tax=Owenia fusiformis TaxID=6347 RepID=A0A8J1UBN3_OWEFU|nr:unnamed protein product [Owenia fusiformis]